MSTSIVRLDQAMILKHLSEFCEVLRDAVEGGASVGFVAPLAVEVNRDFWLKVACRVANVEKVDDQPTASLLGMARGDQASQY